MIKKFLSKFIEIYRFFSKNWQNLSFFSKNIFSINGHPLVLTGSSDLKTGIFRY
jgi:hypothetical protein